MSSKKLETTYHVINILTAVFTVLTATVATVIHVLKINIPFIEKERLDSLSVLQIPESSSQNDSLEFEQLFSYLNIDILFSYFLVGITLLLLLALVTIWKKNSKTEDIAEHMRELVTTFVGGCLSLQNDINALSIPKKRPSKKRWEEISTTIDRLGWAQRLFLVRIATRVSQVMFCCTGEHCSVNIKAFDPKSGEISTFARDDYGTVPRRDSDSNKKPRNYKSNFVFQTLVDNNDTYFFACNNLLRSAKDDVYFNDFNKNWHDYYNSCIVIPISKEREPKRDDIWGFLCVDSKKAKFNKSYTENIVRILAKLLALIFEGTIIVTDQKRNELELIKP